MSRNDKINFFNSKVGNYDNMIAELYLNLTGGNAEQAVQLFLSEREVNQNSNRNIYQNNQIKIEFTIDYERFSNLNVYNSHDENVYNDLVKFLKEKFVYISNNLDNFLNFLKEHAGLIIIFPQEKKFDVRNDMIRAYNDQLCQDIMRNVTILPVMKDSNVGKDLITKCSSRMYPLYLFCKYKNRKVVDIKYKIEGRFNIVNAINNFLDCFPESNIKPSIFKSINESMAKIRNSVINNNNRNNNPNNNMDNNRNNNRSDNILSNSQNYFSGNIDELNELIAKLERNNIQQNNNMNNSINNSQNNNNYSLNNINNSQSQYNINYSYNSQVFNNSNNQSQISGYNNSQSINQQSMNNNISNNPYINNPNQIQNSLIQNNPSLADSIYGLAPGEINAKREREMRELERQHEEKMKKEEEEKRKILEEENEKKAKIEKYEKEAFFCKQNLTEEPDENDPDVCKIMFRYPSGEKTVERRFLKDDQIILLYNYVKSLGREIFSEQNSNDFDLICGFPPKNLENSKDKTLGDEGLFPSSLIQINEK